MTKTSQPLPITGGPRGRGETALPLLLIVAALVILPNLILSQIAAHLRVDVADDQMFGYYGWRIAHGAAPYVDVWDNKPPGIYWLNALGMLLGGDSYGGVIALCVIALLVSHVAFFVIAASVYWRGAAALATVLASFYLTHSYYQGGTNRTETFLVAFELAAVAIYVRSHVRDRWWRYLLAGMLCGAAFLCKQVGLAAWGAMGLHTIWLMLTRQLPWWKGVRRGALLTAGVAVTLAVATLLLVSKGAFAAAWFATFTFNEAYFAVGSSSLSNLMWPHLRLQWDLWPVLKLPYLMALAAVIHAALWRFRPSRRPADVAERLAVRPPALPDPMILFLIWWAAAYYGALVSPSTLRHYLIPSIPPLLLLAGYLISVLKTEISLTDRFQERIWVVAAFVVLAYFAGDAGRYHFETTAKVWWERQPEWVDGHWTCKQSESEIVGREVARLTKPGETIQSWGYTPGVYLAARRPNTCRFTTTEKMGHVGELADFVGQELHDALSAAPPVAFVITGGDWFWITHPDYQPENPPNWVGLWLADFLNANYTMAADVSPANSFIFLRNDIAAQPDRQALIAASQFPPGPLTPEKARSFSDE